MRYSVIVPVYNRPSEVEELLESLCKQTYTDFEVIIVEDGSTIKSQSICEKYSARLSIQYFYKQNSGPGPSRNFGFAKANGDYLVIFDSDCVIPPDYFSIVTKYLAKEHLDVWGGPDRGHGDFTRLQQAMAYSMSSVLTTGGIRGGAKRVGAYQARSFNMGMSREAYQKTGGFKFDRFAEDIEFSLRSTKLGLKVGLINDAFVYHKRRATLKQFFKQVSNFGMGRVHVGRAHKGAIKITHWFPAIFTLGIVILPLTFIFYLVYLLAVFIDSLRITKDITVAFLSIPSVVVQMTGYGTGFLKAIISGR